MSVKKGIFIFTLIGLFLSIAVDYLIQTHNPTFFYYSFLTFFCFLYTLAYDQNNSMRLIGSSLIVAFILSVPLISVIIDSWSNHPIHRLNFLAALPVFAFVTHAFHYSYHRDNTWRINYSTLFKAVWTTIPLLFFAYVFASLADLLILLGAFIFKAAGRIYLWNLYYNNEHFNFISNTTFFFIGLGVGQHHAKIIPSLCRFLVKTTLYLLPILAASTVVYSIVYLINLLTGRHPSVEPLVVMLSFNIFGVLFFNAYFQDGNRENEFPPLMTLLIKIYRVILLVFSLLMAYLVLRDYSVEANLAIYLLCAIFFATTYAITAFFPEKIQQQWIKRGNVATALFFLFSVFAFNLPYAPIEFTIKTKDNNATKPTWASFIHPPLHV